LTLLVSSVNIFSCSTPVFRYALERWEADDYQVAILHRGKLTKKQQNLLTKFVNKCENYNSAVNLYFDDVDLEKIPTKEIEKCLHNNIPKQLPAMIVWKPNEFSKEKPFLTLPFNENNIKKLLQSPVRKELCKRILNQDSVVWLFWGNLSKIENKKLLEQLKTNLSQINTELEKVEAEQRSLHQEAGLELYYKYKFSVLEVDKNNKNEPILAKLLQSVTPEKLKNKPIVLPIFGRGRALVVMDAKKLNKEKIKSITTYLIADCSCQVKGDKMGLDLLLSANWQTIIDQIPEEEPEEIILTTLGSKQLNKKERNTQITSINNPPHTKKQSKIFITLAFIVLIPLIAIILTSIILIKKTKK